jgi:hypothetical protein
MQEDALFSQVILVFCFAIIFFGENQLFIIRVKVVELSKERKSLPDLFEKQIMLLW